LVARNTARGFLFSKKKKSGLADLKYHATPIHEFSAEYNTHEESQGDITGRRSSNLNTGWDDQLEEVKDVEEREDEEEEKRYHHHESPPRSHSPPHHT